MEAFVKVPALLVLAGGVVAYVAGGTVPAWARWALGLVGSCLLVAGILTGGR